MNAGAATTLPMVIQGGMGIGVSNWQLARAVSKRGQLGVVSGTCIDSLLVRRLQDGDPGGHMRRAMERFPLPDVSADALLRYFAPNGDRGGKPYKLLSMWKESMTKTRLQITMLASFVEVYLAKEGHGGVVGINLLTKVQMPNLATLYGAMLAGVDYVLMGAGIPKDIPAVLDAFARHLPACMRFDVEGADRNSVHELHFDPAEHFPVEQFPDGPPALRRPKFLPIVSSHSLATMLSRKSAGAIDGFVVEGPTAGGHNAPPRGRTEYNELGEPIYGERDEADLSEMRALGLPFWLAGGVASPEALREARENGAAGVQIGTLFAYADESGLEPELKARVLDEVRRGGINVKTDAKASPTGFPFKVVELDETNSVPEQYEARPRVCDLGYLRTAFVRPDGRTDYRCPAEPVDTYVKKGGAIEDTVGRKCLCNSLFANIGHAQLREGGVERALLTSGNDFTPVARMLELRDHYSADDALDYLLQEADAENFAAA
jgi:NAD(P)H-dependent flavin oxidoreductase YrpB (nitropropane dioxygenase family)